MNFMEAVKAMKEGKKVRRKEWDNKEFAIFMRYDGVIMHQWADVIKPDDTSIWHLRIKGDMIDTQATDWEIYKEEDEEQDEAEENMLKIKKALKFVEHLENHPEVKNAPINAGIPMCKICDKTIDEIYEGGELVRKKDNCN